MKVLIIRNDKLGDLILSFPAFYFIKQHIPNAQIHAFVPSYTSEIANNYKWIDKVIIDPGSKSNFSSQVDTLKKIRLEKYDAIITLYSSTRVGIFSFLSGVKYRLAPATKIAQIFYNYRLRQRRSQSQKPEFEYNLDLVKKFLSDFDVSTEMKVELPYLQFQEDEIIKIRKKFCDENHIDHKSKFIFIHPGTGGSATNLNIGQFATLARNLNINDRYYFVITAGPDETEYANELSALMKDVPHIIYPSTEGLVHFSKIIQLCNLFISGSTGPLHIAGALNRPTVAFYQRRRSATALRWQTLNSEDRRLSFSPPEDAHESDLQTIDVVAAAKIINEKFLSD